MAGGVPVFVPAEEAEAFIPGYDAIASRITRRTKAIVLTSPSNPCGCVWSRGQLQALADLAVDRKLFVVSDEIYEKLLYDQRRHISIAQLGEQIKRQTIVINGVSKAFAMTGWRIGYAAGPREVISAMGAFQSQATSNPNAIAQHASAVALNSDQDCVCRMVEEFERRRDAICGRINAIPGLSCRRPEGAFYVMMNIQHILGRRYERRPITDSMSFADTLLKAKKVAVVPGVAFEAEGYCRLSYATSMDNIRRGLDRIAEFVSELR